MTIKQPTKRAYLLLDDELQTRINIAFAATKRGKHNYHLNDFLQKLVRDALDQRDDVVGSRAALANRVGDKLTGKMDNVQIMLLAIFYVVSARTNDPDQIRNEAFVWAAKKAIQMEDLVSELRNSTARRGPASTNNHPENGSK